MKPRASSSCGAADRRRARLVLLVLALAAALDVARALEAPAPPTRDAAVFFAIWSALVVIGEFLGTVAAAAAAYLASAVAWLAGRVANFLLASGAMFAKVWEAVRTVWSEAVKPALGWIDTNIRRLYSWLRDTFKPVFEFLEKWHKRFIDWYDTYVRPVTDTIDFIRAVNNVLLAFHIDLLDGLSRVLSQLEDRIVAVRVWVEQQFARVMNALDLIVGADGFFQRYTLVASLRKHLPNWSAYFWRDQVKATRGKDGSYERTRPMPDHEAAEDRIALEDFMLTGDGTKAGIIPELAKLLLDTAASTARPTENTSNA